MKIVVSSSHLLLKYLQPKSGAVFAALDVGTNNVGVAISDQSRVFINPIQNIVRKGGELRMKIESIKSFSSKLNTVVNQHKIDVLVVGLPIHDDKFNPLCHEIVELMTTIQLSRDSTICTFWDESYSSMAAKNMTAIRTTSKSRFLKDKDGLAASYLLRNFFKSHGVLGDFKNEI